MSTNEDSPHICIVGGQGKMGRWFYNFFDNRGISVTVVDRKDYHETLYRVSDADVVLISVPISRTVDVIKDVRERLAAGSLLADITSLKTEPVKAMSQAPKEAGVLGMHPLFGPLVSSMNNQEIVFTRVRDNQWVEYLQRLFVKENAQVVELSPEEHDRRMAGVQVATHAINATFIHLLSELGFTHFQNISTPVFRLQSILAGRILGGDPGMWADMAVHNPYAEEVMAGLNNNLKKIKESVKEGAKDDYEKILQQAADHIKDFIPIAENKSAEAFSILDCGSKVRVTPPHLDTGKDVNTVATLGPEGTFSHQATSEVFSDQGLDVSLQPTITQVFNSVLRDEKTVGVVPIENSSQGMIQQTLDNLLCYPLRVIGSYTMPIHLSFLGRTEELDRIDTVRSHSQPLEQARNWLTSHYPNVKLEAYASTVEAINSTKDPTVAFVAHADNVQKYDLQLLAENIEDKKNNRTQFYIISSSYRPEISNKLQVSRTLMLLTIHDASGVLRNILNAFADRGLNLSRLDSHRSDVPEWDYYFFLEVEAMPDDPPLKDALKEIKKHCYTFRILGII